MYDDIINFYSEYDEENRLQDHYSLERIRTQEIISRFLKSSKLKVLDIGGAAGVYSFWLASLGHEVDLIDLVPMHIEQAALTEKKTGIKLSSIRVGDACKLPYNDNCYDVVLLMGPLYHILEKDIRLCALQESKRVLKLNGILFSTAISRFASLLDGLKYDRMMDNEFIKIVNGDLENGQHINKTGKPEYFTTAFFHHPEELKKEIEESGLILKSLLTVEGLGSCIPNIKERLINESFRNYLLEGICKTEEEPSIIGIGSHLMAIANKNC
jgi:ubiquinone/menaquinone biosynthesis C-methylase UbiE